MGYDISFLLYPFDADWEKSIPNYYRELNQMFEYFSVIPNSRPLHQNARECHHMIDEWWDENLERHVQWLSARKSFDFMFVNYAFFSRAFDFAPRNCGKILDTHDLFTGRREMFAKFGIGPEFFYTNELQESVAFDRADAVIAIKDSEAAQIRKRSKSFVVSLPYWDSFAKPGGRPQLPAEFDHERPLRVGFIGAQNSVNSVNLNRFLVRFERYVRLYDLPVEVVIAGNVCSQIRAEFPFVKKLGRVANIADFYGAIDAIVAPLEFSTGIKIKVAEAMAWGVPVVATANAFDGFRAFNALQAEASVADLCESLVALSTSEITFADLADAGRNSARAAARAQERGFAELRDWMKQKATRNVVVTTRPFWLRATFVDEQIAQATELMAQVAKTIVFFSGDVQPQANRLYTDVDFVQASPEDWASLCAETGQFACIEALLVCKDARAIELANVKAKQFWRLDPTSGLSRYDPALRDASVAKVSAVAQVSTPSSLLRYSPFDAVATLDTARVAIVIRATPSEWDAAAAEMLAVLCASRELEPHRICVGDDALYDESFFAAVVSEPATRWLLIGQGSWAPALHQAAVYRGAACMIVRADLLAPQIVDRFHQPSLMRSFAAFLDGKIQAAPISGPDTGWNEVWR